MITCRSHSAHVNYWQKLGNTCPKLGIVAAVHESQFADPVEAGFVGSLGRPDGTFSGLTLMAPVLAGKRLALLKEAVPTARSVAVLVNTANPGMQSTLRHLQAGALTLEVKLQILDARAAHEVEASLAGTDSRQASALYVSLDPLFLEHSSAHRGLGGKGAAAGPL